VHAQAEIGEDIPRKRPRRLARRLLLAIVVGTAAGLAVMLGIDGWGTLIHEAGGSCGTNRGACPRGIIPALLLSFLLGLWAGPAAIWLLFASGWDRRALVAVAAAGGVLAGQWAWGGLHGQDLAVAWTAGYDPSFELSTVSAWTHADSLIRVRVDGVTSYDGASGRQRWSFTLPGTDIACSASGSPGTAQEAVGLIVFGPEPTRCDHVMAVDLAAGRPLWSAPLPGHVSGVSGDGLLTIAGDTAVVVSDGKPLGYDLRAGALEWTGPGPGAGASDCYTRQVAAAGRSLIALADCQSGFSVLSLDPATGRPAWTARVTEPTDSYQIQVLSADPVVVSDTLTGPRGASRVQVFGAGGQVTASMPVSGIPGVNGPVALDTSSRDWLGPRAVVADGLLVGVARGNGSGSDIVAFRLADGQRQWRVHLPDEVSSPRLAGHEVVLVDESDPAPALEAISLADGRQRAIGFFPGGVYDSGDAALYLAGGQDIIVNQRGVKPTPPVAAITVPPGAKPGA
jgi:outer membrane protein assembly factor BamB